MIPVIVEDRRWSVLHLTLIKPTQMVLPESVQSGERSPSDMGGGEGFR